MVKNAGDTPLHGMELDLGVGWKRVMSRSAIEAWVNPANAHAVSTMATAAVPNVPPQSEIVAEVSLPVDKLRIDGADAGPREVSVSLLGDTGATVATIRTFVMWQPDSGHPDSPPPVTVSMIAPVTVPVRDPADPTGVNLLPSLVEPGGALGGLTASVTATANVSAADTVLGLAVDEAVLAEAIVSETPAVAAWASTVSEMGTDHCIFPLPAFDPDMATLSRVTINQRTMNEINAIPMPGDWSPPDSWQHALAWPADGFTPDLATLRTIRAAGLTRAVVPPATGTAGLGSASPSARPATLATNHGVLNLLTQDAILTSVMTNAVDRGSTMAHFADSDFPTLTAPASQAEAVQRILAELAVISYHSADTPAWALIAFPRGVNPDPEVLASVVAAVEGSGWASFAPVSELIAQSATDVSADAWEESTPQPAELGTGSVSEILHSVNRLHNLALAATNASQLLAPVAPRIIAPLSVGWRTYTQAHGPEVRASLVESAVQEVGSLADGLTATAMEVTMISAEGSLPITVNNSLPADAKVTIDLYPHDSRLIVDSHPSVTVEAGTQSTVYVPVRAIASGDVTVDVRMLDSTGSPVGESTELTLRVRAGWETLGTALVAGGLAVLLVVGLWRTIRRGRKGAEQDDMPCDDADAREDGGIHHSVA
jgi:hypothetical protein